MSLPKPFNVFLANKSLIITGTARPVMGRAAHCWPPWHCPHLAGLHCIYKWHSPPLSFFLFHSGIASVIVELPEFPGMSFASLQLYLFCALAETTPSNTNSVSLPIIPGIIFAGCARVSICSPNVIGRCFFFLSPPPSLFHMSANTVMHTVSARSNCEPGSISIFSNAGSGPASVNRWASLQAA